MEESKRAKIEEKIYEDMVTYDIFSNYLMTIIDLQFHIMINVEDENYEKCEEYLKKVELNIKDTAKLLYDKMYGIKLKDLRETLKFVYDEVVSNYDMVMNED